MAKNIFGSNTTFSNVTLNLVAAYITDAEFNYVNKFPKIYTINQENDFVGFLHTVSGEGIVEINGHKNYLKKDDLIFMHFRDLNSLKSNKTEWKFYCLWFHLNNLLIDYDIIFHVPQLSNERETIQNIIDLLNYNDYYCLCQANGLGMQLVTRLLAVIGTTVNKSAYFDEIRDIIPYIKRNITKNLTVADLAKQCYICEKHFRNLFTEQIGIQPKQYILKTKLEHAAFLLSFSTMNIIEISNELSFSSPAYFTSRFRKYFNMTPSEYRNKR